MGSTHTQKEKVVSKKAQQVTAQTTLVDKLDFFLQSGDAVLSIYTN